MTKSKRFITGFKKLLLYKRIALRVACVYALKPKSFHWSPIAYVRFLARALRLLLIFRHHKAVRVFNGYKIDLYLPAYPSRAFFYALEGKLLKNPPRPVTVVFSMTKACAYKCEHCYQSKDGGPDLNEDLMIQTACGSQNMGVAMFDIEGGEPFMRFPRLLKLVQALDERSEIWVNTAGAGLKPEMLEQLKKAGLFGLMISIHSPDPGKNDAFTGIPGSFEIACNALKLCRQMNLVGAVNSVLSEDEIQNNGLKMLMDLARDLNSDFVQLIHPKPAGLWMGKTENMQRDSELIQNIRKGHLHYNSGLSDYPALATQVFEESETALGCTAGGVDRFYVNAYGEIQPCEFLNLSFGNVKDEPLQRIFDRMRSYFSVPASDWLCCTQAKAIHELFQQHELKQTPLPWPITKTLVEKWDRGKPTHLYKKLRIYP